MRSNTSHPEANHLSGITGIYTFGNSGISPTMLDKMTGTLLHRGGNELGLVFISHNWNGTYGKRIRKNHAENQHNTGPIEIRDPKSVYNMRHNLSDYNIGFGNTQSAIGNSSSNAHQPMSNRGRAIWITYDGAIYNHTKLKKELGSSGYDFRSDSDTEVIVAAYQRWGISCLERFNGMYAFGLWDGNRKILYLVRDRFGIKPLYYCRNQNEFIFASEIKGILANQKYTKDLNVTSVCNYIGLLYVPGQDTIWKDIRSVPPGSYIEVKDNKVSINRYWQVTPNRLVSFGRKKNVEYWTDGIRSGLERAVQRRMVTDMPVGSFLSGGIDSSCLTLLMTQFAGKKVETFSLGFEEDDNQIINELPYAKKVAEHLGTDHYEFVIKYKDFISEIPRAIKCFDEPFAGSLSQYFLSKYAKEHVDICFGGLGADELLGSYGRYLNFRAPFGNRFMLNWLLPENAKKIVGRKSLGYHYFNRCFSVFTVEEKEKLLNKDVFQNCDPSMTTIAELNRLLERPLSSPLDVCCLTDIATQAEGEYLKYTDRLSAAFALEMRSPFIDHEFVEYVFSIPPDERVMNGNLKYLLFEAFGKELPSEVFTRKKAGFSLPYTSWINNGLKPHILDYLSRNAIMKRGLLNPDYISELIKEHYSGKRDHTYKVWSLFILELWFRMYIDSEEVTF